MTSYYHPNYKQYTKEELKEECQRTFNKIKITADESLYLTKSTHLEALTHVWFEHKNGRIIIIIPLNIVLY